VPSIARWVGIDQKNIVLISEYTGGGFGSRIPGYIAMAIPSLLSKKVNAPVMMRIAREDEHYIGRARPALHSRAKVGFDKEGRITALDVYCVVENGPYDQVGDGRSAVVHRPERIAVAAGGASPSVAFPGVWRRTRSVCRAARRGHAGSWRNAPAGVSARRDGRRGCDA